MRKRFGTIRALSLLVAAGALAAGGLSGCAEKASAAEIVRSSPEKTTTAKTAKLGMTMDIGGKSMTGDGVMDLASGRGKMTYDVSALGAPEESGMGGKIDMLLFGTTVYMQMPQEMASKVPGGKPFLKIDMQQAAASQGVDLNALSQGSDPTDGIGYLHGIAPDVKAVGSETVRGAKTTHYKGTVDLNKAKEGATPAKQKSIDAIVTRSGIATFPADIWIDGQGRMRKFTYSMDLSKAAQNEQNPDAKTAAAQVGAITITMELFDYGTPVSVTEPPADQVTDMAQLTQQSGQSSATVGSS